MTQMTQMTQLTQMTQMTQMEDKAFACAWNHLGPLLIVCAIRGICGPEPRSSCGSACGLVLNER
jgi:hypothetical protein